MSSARYVVGDIVERLRDLAWADQDVTEEAANEIERLRKLLAQYGEATHD